MNYYNLSFIVYIFFSIFLYFILSISISWSKDMPSDFNDLPPPIKNLDEFPLESILDGMIIDAPDYVKSILKDQKIVFSTHFILNKNIYIFYQRGECPDYGCAIVALSRVNNKFFDPIIIFSKNEIVEDETRAKLLFLTN